MTERRLLAILALLLALIGGTLVIVGAFDFPSSGNPSLEFLARRAFEAALGIAAILGGVSIFRGRMAIGGFVTLVIGIALIILGAALLEAVLIIVGGVLGVVGAEVRR